MGNSASHAHESLDKGFSRGTFGDVKNTVCTLNYFGFLLYICQKFVRLPFATVNDTYLIINFFLLYFPQAAASFRFSKRSPKKMDRLRRSFRDSFRRRKDRVPESSKPHQWQDDDQAVRKATCSFPVKYLGCVEVFESRGMQVCEEALKVLRVCVHVRPKTSSY